jgi:hypothetical protein
MSDNVELPAAKLSERQDVIELLEECKTCVKETALRYHATAELNERMCNGDQFIEIGEGYEVGPAEWGADVPKISRNLLRNLRLTWSSRILEDRPFVQFYPAEAGVDQIKVQVAEKVIEYVKQQNDYDDLCFRAAELVQPHSCVGWKTIWDPLKGPRDDQGNPMGDVTWHIVSLFDYGTDGSEDIEDSKWVYFCKHIDKWDAKALLAASGITDEPEMNPYYDIWGVKKEGVKVYELWWRPDDYRYPQGIYSVIVGDHVVECRDFPYEHGELPIAIWKCGARRNSPYGSTHVDDAVPIQRLINECVAALAKQTRLISTIKLLATTDIIAKWEHGHQKIPVTDIESAQYTRYLEPPNRVQVLVDTMEDAIDALYNVFGLNEMLTGADNLKSGTAAKSIAYINKLDSMKMSGAARNFAKMIMRVVRQTLKLMQQYVVAPRLMKIAGTSNQLITDLFVGADIAGVDIVVQPGSSIETMRASIADNANQTMQKTGPTPELQAQSETGLKDSAYTQSQKEIVFAQIQAALKGQPEQSSPDVDANIAVSLITEMLNAVGPAQQPVLMQLMQQYKQSLTQQNNANSADNLAIKTAGGMKQ